MSEFFKIERVKEDIPFYNGTPELSRVGWILLVLGFLIYTVLIRTDFVNPYVAYYGALLVVGVPIIYACRGNYSVLFKRLTKKDIRPIIIVTVLGLIYSLITVLLLASLGVGYIEKDLWGAFNQFLSDGGLIALQLVGEELYKIIMLILFMFLFYKLSNNRKTSVVLSIILAAVIFGAGHEGTKGTLIQVIIVQGGATLMDFILYLNTKNVVASYVSHVVFDLFGIALKIFSTAVVGSM